MPRIYAALPLQTGAALALPEGAARHVQVLRLQPGDALTLFNGGGGEWDARVTQMGRSHVNVEIGSHHASEREAPRAVHLALGMPANERMDWLVEKAAELGVASIQPLLTERTVLRLTGERAEKKRAHWQAVAIAACEQCGRNRVPLVHAPITFNDWAKALKAAPAETLRLLLSLRDTTQPLQTAAAAGGAVLFLSGPEGGLSPVEEDGAIALGFAPVTLGTRVLRAETAPLAALAALTLS